MRALSSSPPSSSLLLLSLSSWSTMSASLIGLIALMSVKVVAESNLPLDPRCSLEPITGFCRAAFPGAYFDAASGTCREFTYGGCGGNGLIFYCVAECQLICVQRKGINNFVEDIEQILAANATTDADGGPAGDAVGEDQARADGESAVAAAGPHKKNPARKGLLHRLSSAAVRPESVTPEPTEASSSSSTPVPRAGSSSQDKDHIGEETPKNKAVRAAPALSAANAALASRYVCPLHSLFDDY